MLMALGHAWVSRQTPQCLATGSPALPVYEPSRKLPVYSCIPGWSEYTSTPFPETGSCKLWMVVCIIHISLIVSKQLVQLTTF